MKVAIQTKFKETDIGHIPAEWDLKPLKDLTTKIGSGATPRGGNDAYIDNGPYALVRSQNIYDDRFEYNGLAHISDDQAAELSNVEVEEGDVLLNITGASLGRANIVPKNILPARVNQHVAILRSNGKLDPHFLKGWLHLPQVKSYILGHNAGGTREAITKEMIENFVLPVPPLSEQKQIAETLSSLDDKIELNRAINSNLEKLASAIFKKWFVDMGDELPKGWRAGIVSELSDVIHDVLNPVRFQQELFDHYSIPAFDEGRVAKVELGSTIKSQKNIVPENAVLLSKLNPRTSRVWLPLLNKSRRAICSTEFLVVIPKVGVSREFLYCLFSSSDFIHNFATLVTGTSGSHQRVKLESLLNIEIAIPPIQVLDQFAELVRPFLDLINENIRESNYLRLILDSLLPRLMSGRIRVS